MRRAESLDRSGGGDRDELPMQSNLRSSIGLWHAFSMPESDSQLYGGDCDDEVRFYDCDGVPIDALRGVTCRIS